MIIGEVAVDDGLRAVIREVGLDGHLTVLGPRTDMPEVYGALDPLVSSSRGEGMSNAILEAMAVEVPVVATSVGGTVEVVDHGRSGLLVPPQDPLALAAGIAAVVAEPARAQAMGRAGRRIVTALYAAALRYVDTRLQELAGWLETCGLWDRTLLVVTADHGQTLGERGSVGHNFDLTDSVLRVPLVLRCPGRVPQGFVSEELAQSTDILPTVLQLLGVEKLPEPLHGHALLEGGRAAHGPAFAVAEHFRPRVAALQRRYSGLDLRALDVREKAIRTRRYKYVWRSDEINAFYDLQADSPSW